MHPLLTHSSLTLSLLPLWVSATRAVGTDGGAGVGGGGDGPLGLQSPASPPRGSAWSGLGPGGRQSPGGGWGQWPRARLQLCRGPGPPGT